MIYDFFIFRKKGWNELCWKNSHLISKNATQLIKPGLRLKLNSNKMVATSGKISLHHFGSISPRFDYSISWRIHHVVFLALRRVILLSVLLLIWVPPLEGVLIDPNLWAVKKIMVSLLLKWTIKNQFGSFPKKDALPLFQVSFFIIFEQAQIKWFRREL